MYLFDKVLEKVNANAKISPSLVSALGWSDSISVEKLTDQLRRVLDGSDDDKYARMKNIVKELAKAKLTPSQREALREVVDGQKWVPTSEEGVLAESWEAVFSSAFTGVFTISPALGRTKGVRQFLKLFGCLERCVGITASQGTDF